LQLASLYRGEKAILVRNRPEGGSSGQLCHVFTEKSPRMAFSSNGLVTVGIASLVGIVAFETYAASGKAPLSSESTVKPFVFL
jgi:hypothetical protein